ncbi:MAG: DUF2087 domain-containing protein [Chloroflexota bacterium]
MADDPAYEARVLRAFIRGDRLVSIPARERKRLVVLRFLVDQVFPDLEPLEERDVNMRLALWHPDVAALRRYLVEAGLAERSAMTYRRSSGAPEAPERERPVTPPVV